jgi:hypothetical protein
MVRLWQTEVSLKEEWEWFTKTAWNTALLADKAKLTRISTALHEVTAQLIIAASLEHFEAVLKMT